MGLDIMFYKVKPSKGVNVNSIEELSKDRDNQFKRKFNRVVNKYLKTLKDTSKYLNSESVAKAEKAINNMRNYVQSIYPNYNWYWEWLTADTPIVEIIKKIGALKKSAYLVEDVYFRKVNFIYRFFQPYLENEECIVEHDQVVDLIERCDRVIAAATECGVIVDGEIIPKYFYRKDYYQLNENQQEEEKKRVEKELAEMPKEWVKIADELLPTQAGFFFGSTDYNPYYLADVIDCKEKFTKLLNDWKDGEVVYNYMSW